MFISKDVRSYFKVDVDDYHEFDYIKKMLEKTVGLLYDYQEIDSNSKYSAVFWIGEKPVDYIEKLSLKIKK